MGDSELMRGAAASVPIRSFRELVERAGAFPPKRVAVVAANDEVALTAIAHALALHFAVPILIGDIAGVRSAGQALGLKQLLDEAEFVPADGDVAMVAAQMAGQGRVDILMKGHLRTDELLHAVLDKRNGLRTESLLSDVLLFENIPSGERKLIAMCDGGLNVAPTLAQKRQIARNTIAVMQCLGVARPKVAILSATEVVSEGIPSTLDAQALTAMGAAGDLGDAEVFGPLALDNALLESAAQLKGIQNPVAGHADCLIVHCIEAGNHLGKSAKYWGGSQCAHVIVGAKVPVLIPSRVESTEDKLNSIALGVVFASR
jgi:phosphate butyryltransferase